MKEMATTEEEDRDSSIFQAVIIFHILADRINKVIIIMIEKGSTTHENRMIKDRTSTKTITDNISKITVVITNIRVNMKVGCPIITITNAYCRSLVLPLMDQRLSN